jgi:hypothetical protein
MKYRFPNARLIEAPIDHLKFDPAYQRDIDIRRVRQIAKSLKEGAAKAVSVSERDNGDLYVYDGQHTVAAFKLAGYTHVPAVIVKGSQKEEAEWFLDIQQGSKRVFMRDAHKAGCVSKDEISLVAQSILDKYGIGISKGGVAVGMTGAIGAIRRYAKADKKALLIAMDAIKKLWTHESEAWTSVVLRGMFEIAQKQDMSIIVAAARKNKVIPRRIHDTASAIQEGTGSSGSGAGVSKRAILMLCKVSEHD